MLKKAIVGVLLVSVLGAGGAAAAYNLSQPAPVQDLPAPAVDLAVTVPTAAAVSGQQAGAGSQYGNGQNSNQTGANGTPQAQVAPGDWITFTGTLTSVNNGLMAMQTADGQLISFQTGQPSFFQQQGVTFAVGDAVEVLGFWEGDAFSAGEITQLSTGARVMLRDPNGRPLWAGGGNEASGGNGQQGGQGQQGQGNSQQGGQTQQGQGNRFGQQRQSAN